MRFLLCICFFCIFVYIVYIYIYICNCSVSISFVSVCFCVLGNSLRDNLKVFAWLWVIQLLELSVNVYLWVCGMNRMNVQQWGTEKRERGKRRRWISPHFPTFSRGASANGIWHAAWMGKMWGGMADEGYIQDPTLECQYISNPSTFLSEFIRISSWYRY